MYIDVGFANYVKADKIVGLSKGGSSPIKRLIKEAREEGRFVDVTEGRKTRTIIYTECGSLVLLTASAVKASTIIERINRAKSGENLMESIDSFTEEVIVH